ADQMDAPRAARLAQRSPLPGEGELDELVVEDRLRQLGPASRDRLRLARDERGVPGGPAGPLVDFLQGHVQGVVAEPVRLILAERLEVEVAGLEAAEGPAEERLLGRRRRLEVDAIIRQRG